MIGVLATAAQAVCCGAFVLLWRRLAHDPAILAFAVCSGLSALGFASFVVLHDGTTFDPASRLLLNLLNVAALTVGTWGLLRRSEVDVRFGIAVAIGAFGAATSATAILSAPESPSGLVCAYAVFAVLWAAGGTITAGRADGDGLRLAIGSVALLLAVVPLSTVALHHVLVGRRRWRLGLVRGGRRRPARRSSAASRSRASSWRTASATCCRRSVSGRPWTG